MKNTNIFDKKDEDTMEALRELENATVLFLNALRKVIGSNISSEKMKSSTIKDKKDTTTEEEFVQLKCPYCGKMSQTKLPKPNILKGEKIPREHRMAILTFRCMNCDKTFQVTKPEVLGLDTQQEKEYRDTLVNTFGVGIKYFLRYTPFTSKELNFKS